MIMISGEHTGGFYALYLLTALPFGITYALVGTAGIIILLLNYNLNRSIGVIKQSLNIGGLALLLYSLLLFFKSDTKHYNWGTFEQGFPVFTIVFTCFIALCFLVGTFWRPTKLGTNQSLSSTF